MKITIDCFIPYRNKAQVAATVAGLKQIELVDNIYLLTTEKKVASIDGCTVIKVNSLTETATVKQIAECSQADYTLLYTSYNTLEIGLFGLERMARMAVNTNANMAYADYYRVTGETRVATPLIECQFGSVRDDFNFGPLFLYNTRVLSFLADSMDVPFQFAGLYDLRLRSSDTVFESAGKTVECLHINEYLYSEVQSEAAECNESLFDYVDPKNQKAQREMEMACTVHLNEIGAYLLPKFKAVSLDDSSFEYEASVIIPVRNRVRTIDDAIRSVFAQKTNFKFNLIIIDNHSTDGTTQAIDAYASDSRLIHLTPEQNDLEIGGCWNVGVHHPACGKFAIQLDSDDVYSGEDALQKMVDAFYEQHCAMVVGTYRTTDFDLNTIPPGIVDHKEWTPRNGRNNAFRVNGFGAPRGFYTPLLREIKVPNTSYGEDYALGLAFSRHYKIGRVYDVVYLCRRWEDNSDAQPDLVKMNTFNTYKDSIRTAELTARIRLNIEKRRSEAKDGVKLTPDEITYFLSDEKAARELVRVNYQSLQQTRTRELLVDGYKFVMQYNPERIHSTAAKKTKKSSKEQSCVLCRESLPADQLVLPYDEAFWSKKDKPKKTFRDFVLVNPYPVFPEHLTIVSETHIAQYAPFCIPPMLELGKDLPGFTFFYNGPTCGASVPDHNHFQAGTKGVLPIESEISNMDKMLLYKNKKASIYSLKDGLRTALLLESGSIGLLTDIFIYIYYEILKKNDRVKESDVNIISWYEAGTWTICIFCRSKHRPSCYGSDENSFLISPAAVEMGGLFVLPREEDFEKITSEDVKRIIQEVSYDAPTMEKMEALVIDLMSVYKI